VKGEILFSFLTLVNCEVNNMVILLLYVERPNAILSSFSMLKNVKELIGIRSGGNMDCLHGIRSLSTMSIVLSHTYTNAIRMPVVNFIDVPNVSEIYAP